MANEDRKCWIKVNSLKTLDLPAFPLPIKLHPLASPPPSALYLPQQPTTPLSFWVMRENIIHGSLALLPRTFPPLYWPYQR